MRSRLSKKAIWLLGVSLVLGLGCMFYLVQSWSFKTSLPTSTPVNPSGLRSAPSFELEDSNHRRRQLNEFRGSVVLVHFWAAWCPPCLEEIKAFVQTARRYEGKKVIFIAMSLDERWEKAYKILPPTGLPEAMVYLIDPEIRVPEAYGTYQFPETYLLDSELKIRKKWVGPQNWDEPKIQNEIQQLLPPS